MSPKFEAPSFEALVVEQEAVQARKFQGRLLDEYSHYIFPGQHWRIPRSSEVTDFLRPYCISERVSLEGVVEGLSEASGDDPIHWVDMGSGRGLAMRQLAAKSARRGRIAMTGVDLFDVGLNGLKPDDITRLEKVAPGITDEAAAPQLIRADMETVELPQPANLITSVEAIQYLNNPLAAIGNWYNQLVDNGLLVISTEHDWSSWIRYPREFEYENTPIGELMQTFKATGVPFAASYDIDWENGFRPRLNDDRLNNLAIQRLPGTKLLINAALTEIWTNPYDFKAAYYEEPVPGSKPIIEVAAE